MSQALLKMYLPIVHVPKESAGRKLIEVLFEVFPKYVVMWFHWPFDDYTGKADYEPVILFFRGNNLVALGIRPHKKYKHYIRWLTEGMRPVVMFESGWHAPVIVQGSMRDSITAAFSSSKISERLSTYPLVPGKPPSWYDKDGTEVSVYNFAEKIVVNMGL